MTIKTLQWLQQVDANCGMDAMPPKHPAKPPAAAPQEAKQSAVSENIIPHKYRPNLFVKITKYSADISVDNNDLIRIP